MTLLFSFFHLPLKVTSHSLFCPSYLLTLPYYLPSLPPSYHPSLPPSLSPSLPPTYTPPLLPSLLPPSLPPSFPISGVWARQ